MMYLKSYENYDSNIININVDNKSKDFKLRIVDDKPPIEVFLMLDDEKYLELSIIIPDSNKLNKTEFFMNPKINQNIIDQLKTFITKTDKVGNAAGENVFSYSLGF